MASFRKYRGKTTATVRIPRDYGKAVKSYSISETFSQKTKARDWARRVEDSIKLGLCEDPRLVDVIQKNTIPTLSEALSRYLRDVVPTKKGEKQEAQRVNKWLEHQLSQRLLDQITPADIAAYRDERLRQKKSPSTVRNEIGIISALFEVARHEWLYDVENPVRKLRQRKNSLPRLPPGRERTLRDGEEQAILEALKAGPHGLQMYVITVLAIETGMRQGELLSLRRDWFEGPDIVQIPDTKNGTSRRVILSDRAVEAIKMLPPTITQRIFSIDTNAVVNSWKRARKMADADGLRFHDLRHEALTRMANAGVSIKVMMRQSGHSTPAMLMRYINPSDDEVRDQMQKMHK